MQIISVLLLIVCMCNVCRHVCIHVYLCLDLGVGVPVGVPAPAME